MIFPYRFTLLISKCNYVLKKFIDIVFQSSEKIKNINNSFKSTLQPIEKTIKYNFFYILDYFSKQCY